MSHLNQLHEVFKVHLIINCELAVVVDDTVVLHLAITAHTQGVVTGEVGALSHQVQAGFRRVKQLLCLVPRYLPMKPSGRDKPESYQCESNEWPQWNPPFLWRDHNIKNTTLYNAVQLNNTFLLVGSTLFFKTVQLKIEGRIYIRIVVLDIWCLFEPVLPDNLQLRVPVSQLV